MNLGKIYFSTCDFLIICNFAISFHTNIYFFFKCSCKYFNVLFVNSRNVQTHEFELQVENIVSFRVYIHLPTME